MTKDDDQVIEAGMPDPGDGDAMVWVQLSELTQKARLSASPAGINTALEDAAKRDTKGTFAPAYRVWAADNLVAEARFEEAIVAYRTAHAEAPDVAIGDRSWSSIALEQIAVSHDRSGDPKAALGAYDEATKVAGEAEASWLQFQAARVAESIGSVDAAADAYSVAASGPDDFAHVDVSVADVAKRSLDWLRRATDWTRPDVETLARDLSRAITSGDRTMLAEMASRSFFRVGTMGSEFRFVDVDDALAVIGDDLADSTVTCDYTNVSGSGGKSYLASAGWHGRVLVGRVMLVLSRLSGRWEWSGVVLTQPNAELARLIPPSEMRTNQPLPTPFMKAPWPAGISFRAGGVLNFGAEALAVSAIPFGFIAAGVMSANDCGWGPAGFYYNQFGHNGSEQAFAVDFTRYRRGIPLVDATNHVQVLSCLYGVVSMVRAQFADGDPTLDNRVEVNYVVSGSEWNSSTIGLTAPTRLRGKFLHLSGPSRIPVSVGMFARRGAPLGLMDDTGLSAFPHLHFSIHDRDMGFASVRPTPIDGQTLNDGENYKCIRSTNVPFVG